MPPPPPPPGFILDPPPPPAGYVLDKPPQKATVADALWHGFLHGGSETGRGALQLGEHILKGLGADIDTSGLDRRLARSQAKYEQSPGVQQHPIASGIGRFGGQAAVTAPLAAVPFVGPETALGRAAFGAATGAAGAMAQPVTGGQDFAAEKTWQGLAGAGTGAGLSAVGSAVGNVLAPRLAPDAAELAKKDVVLMPGQMVRRGDIVRDFEERAESLPFLRTFIQDKRARSIDTFNTSTINQALEPIGKSLPLNIAAGHDAIKKMGDTISGEYKSIMSNIPRVQFDQDLVNAFKAIELDARRRPGVWRNFSGVMNNLISQKLLRTRPMTGDEVQKWTSDLWREAKQLNKSQDFFQREEGRLLGEARSSILDAVSRQYPDQGARLEAANRAWAMGVRIEDAAGRRAASQGRFTPMDLLASVKQGAGGVRRREFSRGDALMQKWAETGQRVLPSTLGESGTTPRAQLYNPFALTLGAAARLPYGLYAAAGRSQPGPGRLLSGETARYAPGVVAPTLVTPTIGAQIGDIGPQGGEITDIRGLPTQQ